MGKEGRRVNGFTAIVEKQSSHHATGKGPSRRCPCLGGFPRMRAEDVVKFKRRKPYIFDGKAARRITPPNPGKRHEHSVEPIFGTIHGHGLSASSIVKTAKLGGPQVREIGSWW